jgi:opacity protein-like surface antigen
MRNTAWILAGALALTAAPAMAADGDGAASSTHLPWARWQGRLSLGTASTPWRLGIENQVSRFNSASLMGDYYFGPSLTGPSLLGGFRATSGLIIGPRSMLSTGQPGLATGGAFNIGSRPFGVGATLPYMSDAASDTATVPYLGVGYTGLSVRSRWSFSADLGLVAQSPGNAVRLGRAFGGGQSLDDAVRDLRMTPLLQLGVSYSF